MDYSNDKQLFAQSEPEVSVPGIIPLTQFDLALVGGGCGEVVFG